ncbi:hypothetical protein BU17DRAFT_36181 [Hysterangium stoloniferum]|nr:hypothetical protein BU17DRAFT_36181 [Hysterangium stoloniferum]
MSNPTDSTEATQTNTDSLSPATARKARRQTSFYPNTTNKPQNPFSRSAAKRESVMTLGSIEHLQHYFTKAGISARQNPLKPSSNLVPALGPAILRTDMSHDEHPNLILPPSPMIPPQQSRPTFPPFVKTYQVDPDVLKPGVIEDLEAVERAWSLSETESKPRDPDLLGAGSPSTFDVLSVLKTTTRTIRSVRNYLVSLPDDYTTTHITHSQFRPSTLSPRIAGTPRKLDPVNDPLAKVRKSALDVLSVLRHLEEKARVPLSDDVYDAQSDAGSSSTRSHTPGGTERVASPFTTTSGEDDDESNVSFSFSVIGTPSQSENQKNRILVWSDEEDDEENNVDKPELWDHRLVLGGGWLYKQDLNLEGLAKEREVVARYLDAVDSVLFDGSDRDHERRGWQREKSRLTKAGKPRRQSSGGSEGKGKSRRMGMLDMVVSEEPEDMFNIVEDIEGEDEEGTSEDGIDDDELPDWAKRSRFEDNPLARLLSLLVSLLPADLLSLLPPPSDSSRSTLLLRMSSGQILCTAYNIAVRKSKQPWGYISKAAIHDIAALEAQAELPNENEREKRKKGWTFRRTDNLRLWAAALKLRYMIPLGPVNPSKSPVSPGGNITPVASPGPSQQTFSIPAVEDQNPLKPFDPRLVARREDGWEAMLESAVLKWMWAVVNEQRGVKRW